MEDGLRARSHLDGDVVVARAFDARLVGQGSETPFVPMPSTPIEPATVPELVERFHAEYEARNGTSFRDLSVELVTLRVEITDEAPKVEFPPLAARVAGAPEAVEHVTVHHLYGDPRDVPAYRRASLCAGDEIAGPAIVREGMSTTVVPDGATLVVGGLGELVITADRFVATADRDARTGLRR